MIKSQDNNCSLNNNSANQLVIEGLPTIYISAVMVVTTIMIVTLVNSSSNNNDNTALVNTIELTVITAATTKY